MLSNRAIGPVLRVRMLRQQFQQIGISCAAWAISARQRFVQTLREWYSTHWSDTTV
jgi:hypothetical protein